MARIRRSQLLLLLAALALVVVLIAGAVTHYRLPRYDEQSTDIHFTYLDGQRILSGENPYARILSGNMRENQKYSTYFPLFFLLAAGTQWLGLARFEEWLSFWRIVLLLCNVGTGLVIFLALRRRGASLLGFFGLLFWFFNRWTLQITPVGALEYLPIFFLVLSLVLLPRHRSLALVLFGVSLALKQIAVFLTPLYLIAVWQSTEQNRWRQLVWAGVLIAAVPVAVSLPFLAWNAEGFVRSIVFSATRDAASHFNAPSLDGYLGLTGLTARLPMIAMMGLVYLMMVRRTLGIATASFLVMAVFLSFNPVAFLQYFCWEVPLLLLAVTEGISSDSPEFRSPVT